MHIETTQLKKVATGLGNKFKEIEQQFLSGEKYFNSVFFVQNKLTLMSF